MADIRGDRIRELRRELNLNQEELAMKIGVNRTTVLSYENGKRNPEISTLIALARMFSCTVDYLLGVSDNRHNDIDIEKEDNWSILKNSLKKHNGKRRDAVIKVLVGFMENTAKIGFSENGEKLFWLCIQLFNQKSDYLESIGQVKALLEENSNRTAGEMATYRTVLDMLSDTSLYYEKEIAKIGAEYINSFFLREDGLLKMVTDTLFDGSDLRKNWELKCNREALEAFWFKMRDENK